MTRTGAGCLEEKLCVGGVLWPQAPGVTAAELDLQGWGFQEQGHTSKGLWPVKTSETANSGYSM